MNFWKVILATVVIFGAGVMTGGLLVNYVERVQSGNRHSSSDNRDSDLPAPRAEILSKPFLPQLDKALQLTPEQHTAIEKIIAEGQERNRETWKLVSPQFRPIMQDVQRQIREQLTAEQQKQFGELLKKYRQQRRQQNSTNAPPDLSATNSPTPAPAN